MYLTFDRSPIDPLYLTVKLYHKLTNLESHYVPSQCPQPSLKILDLISLEIIGVYGS